MQISFPQKSTFDTVRANKLMCPEIDTVGVDLVLKRNGIIGTTYGLGFNYQSQDVIIGADNEIQDSGNFVIIASDNLGHVDQLARIDAELNTKSKSHIVSVVPAAAISHVQTGTTDETSGEWTTVANDALYIRLSALIPYKHITGVVKVEDIQVHINTVHNSDFVSLIQLREVTLTDSSIASVGGTLNDLGNGSVGDEVGVCVSNYELLPSKDYYIILSCTVLDTNVIVRGITVKYSLV